MVVMHDSTCFNLNVKVRLFNLPRDERDCPKRHADANVVFARDVSGMFEKVLNSELR